MYNTCGCKKAESFDADGMYEDDDGLMVCKYCNSTEMVQGDYTYCSKCDQTNFITQENMNAESFDAEYSVDKLSKMSFREIDRKSGFLGDRLANFGVMDSWTELTNSKRKEILNKIKKKESGLGWEAESFEAQHYIDEIDFELLKEYVGNLNYKEYKDFCYEFDIDFEDLVELDSFLMSNTSNSKVLSLLGIESFDEAMSDNVSFPEKEYEIDDRDIYNPDRAAMDMIRGNRALREEMEEQGVYVGRHPGYYDDNGRWVELTEHYDDYERIPNWLQGLVGVGLVGGLTYLLTKISGSTTDAGNNTNNTTE